MKPYRDWRLTSKLTIPVGAVLLVGAIGAGTVIYQQRIRQVRDQAGKMAHALALQIAEDRTYYTANVVGKLTKDGIAITTADSGFRGQPGAIPLPATFVKEVTEAINKKGYYKADLISGWPINKAKAPRTPFEREAFAAVVKDPKTPREALVDEGGQARLLYVSADVAGAQACVSCHNAHPDSPKKDFTMGDVMGALVVEIPVATEIAAARAEAGMMIGGMAVVVLMLLGTLFAITRRFIQQPVGAITPIFEQMAQGRGDLTVRLRVTGEDEVGQLSRWFNTFMDKLQEVMRQVTRSAEQLSSASQQLSAGSGQLSSGAHGQAANLEETAAALEEITGTVKQNADNAKQASQLAMGSRDVAEKGGQVVAEAVRSMKEINQSSRKIADIIATIDEIAFQTNLLALNAAVEAARAGEQGRGFAVVASEVRNLAQRSATAAKEIKGLIQDSVAKVEAGSELVNRSGETLTEIVGSVKRVTDIIAEIAAASQEQTLGIDQVNRAVAQMDQVTQSNAAQTEELSSTAQALAGQARELQALVGRFKLGDGGTSSEPPSRHGAPRPAAARPVTRGRRDAGRGPVRKTDEVLMPVAPAAGNGKGPHKDDGYEEV